MRKSNFNKEGQSGFSMFKKTNVPQPIESEDKGKGIIKWGSDNLYPQFLGTLFNSCALHSGIINSKVHYIVSGGLAYEGNDSDKYDLFFKNGNSNFDLFEVTEKLALDLELFNGFCIKGKWKVDKSGIDYLEHVDFEKVRKQYTFGNKISVSEDWSDSKTQINELSPFNTFKREDYFYLIYETEGKQNLLGRKIITGNYPTPPYSGGVISIMTDNKVTTYQLNEISNNLSLGSILNLNNGRPIKEEDQDKLEKRIKDTATGEDNAGSVLVLYNNGKENEASVVTLNGNDLNNRYLSLSKDVRENIMLSHSITAPVLFGVKTEGSLGNSSELEMGYNIMNANYFEHRRKIILSSLNYLASKGNGLQGKIKFNKVLLFPKSEEEVKENEQFAKGVKEESKILGLFSSMGIDRGSKEFKSRALSNGFDIDKEEDFCRNEFSKASFISELQGKVLGLIKDGNNYNSILSALNIDAKQLTKIWKELIRKDLINNGSVTDAGLKELEVKKGIVEIYYSYDKNPEISGADLLDTSREFCVQLVTLSKTKVWSRSDIETISNVMGYNVFSYRGGWYNNPKTKRNTPWCRHVWKQEVFINK